MKKVKITQDQYNRLLNQISESFNIKDDGIDINRVNKTVKREMSKISEYEKLDITKPVPGIPNSKMKMKKEIREGGEILPELLEKFNNLVYNNLSQEGLSTFFVKNGITWGDLMAYLTSVGILGVAAGGVIKIKNILGKKYTSNEEKEADLPEIAQKAVQKIEQDKEKIITTYNAEEGGRPTDLDSKMAAQSRPDSGWKATPKGFNPNQHRPWSNEEKSEEDMVVKENFKPVYLGEEIAILNGPDGMYVLYFDEIEDLQIADENVSIEDVARHINKNVETLKIGDGLKDWRDLDFDLIKIDEELKEKLINLYDKDKELIKILHKLEEMTTTSSSGVVVGKMGMAQKKNITRGYTPADQINKMINDEELAIYEMTATGGPSAPNPQGQYVQPKIWAKDMKNWRGAKKTLYPKGEMVKFDPCTKLNNNKKAQQGKCSQGAVDNVVKTYKTKGSVISDDAIFETISKKTGKTIEEIKKIIKTIK